MQVSVEFIRCFIAIELPENFKKALAGLQSALGRGRTPFVKWVEPAGIHLTLKFLRSVSASTVDEIVLAMEESVKGVASFRLNNSGLGVFPNMDRVKVIWVGLKGEINSLDSLQKRLEDNIEQLGFPRESRAFTPHLTLARIREDALPEERQKIGKRILSASFDEDYDVPVSSMCLIKSQLTPGGAIYTRLANIDFNGT
ncbi:RNA 2',3'-cyclic phosphodiesterase [Chloroflexota bacterium]